MTSSRGAPFSALTHLTACRILLADFNLQEEASIPEDIFDQHDGDIGDEDIESAHIQYAPSAAAATDVDVETEDDDDDDDDVRLLEEDDDASDAADIVSTHMTMHLKKYALWQLLCFQWLLNQYFAKR